MGGYSALFPGACPSFAADRFGRDWIYSVEQRSLDGHFGSIILMCACDQASNGMQGTCRAAGCCDPATRHVLRKSNDLLWSAKLGPSLEECTLMAQNLGAPK